MLPTVAQFIPWLTAYGYLVLFPGAVVEGPIITILAGFLISQGVMAFLPAALTVIAGDLVGDSLYYAAGRYGRRLPVIATRVHHVEAHFQAHAGKTLLLGKLTQGIGGVILMAAGAAPMPFGRFLGWNTLGTIPKTIGLLVHGYFFGAAYQQLDRYLHYAGWGIVLVVVLGILFYSVIMKKVAKQIGAKTDTPL
jgi:membrane protein DedA with SNARE-associated domain